VDESITIITSKSIMTNLVEFVCDIGIGHIHDVDETLVGRNSNARRALWDDIDESRTGGKGTWREGAHGTQVVNLHQRIRERPALSIKRHHGSSVFDLRYTDLMLIPMVKTKLPEVWRPRYPL
jgi:hypothetical protein